MTNIYIYHGEDNSTSRLSYIDHLKVLKTKGYEIVPIIGKELTSELLETNLSSNSLFGNLRALAIENFFSLSKSKEREDLVEKISKYKETIVFWEPKDLSKTVFAKSPFFTFKNFKLPQVLFNFLDSIVPKKPKENLSMLQKTIEYIEEGYIFAMMARQIRLLILAKDKCLDSMLPWQSGKLYKQAENFEMKKLITIYNKILEIDYLEKTSQTPFSLFSQLQILMMTI